MEKAIQFYLNDKDDIISNHEYTIVDYLDDENAIVEVIVEDDDWKNIKRESLMHDGFYCTYTPESLIEGRYNGKLIYAVSTWCYAE